MKKHTPYTCYDDMLSDYYGCHRPPRKKKKHRPLTQSFDNGEVIPGKDSEPFQEYIVAASMDKDGDVFEEYIVMSSSTADETGEEEYVVASFSYNGDNYDPASTDPGYIATASTVSANQDLQTDVLNQFAGAAEADPAATTDTSAPAPAPVYGKPPAPAKPAAPAADTGVPAPDAAHPDTDSLLSDLKQMQQPPSTAQEAGSGSLSSREEEIVSDLQAILSGKKVYDAQSKSMVSRDELGKAQSVSDNGNSNGHTAGNDPGAKNEHAIFDRIAQNMKFANAYNLGTIQVDTEELNNRFNEFDRVQEAPPSRPSSSPKNTSNTVTAAPQKMSEQEDFDPAEFMHDLDEIHKQGQSQQPAATVEAQPAPSTQMSPPADFPPRPTNLRPLTSQERANEFGAFAFVPDPSTFGGDGIRVTDNWMRDNITSVDIPQLNGKLQGGRPIQHGSINFHRAGAERLRRLWAAWEAAGLLDRVLTFEGGYAARFIRHTEGRNPRPLSNHSWGTAFDINASQNGFGQEPAQMGQRGCVRELVAIANQHGFFWGGHFRGHKDGMHFELGKVI
ncbi:MAG TPA: M15 family metallopeptidase [Chitinophaga sp.]|uniref:M15 family metallopeptidase n=1 Tax=Chitinophaga sp. TaxID=1869181 RepID=UPI002CB16018|nr:M15 family metallopeptidase [Chitinophaga sp.]HVI43988.1 M15 family metallopeptidase [Chitinophaga sp.]